MNGCDGRKQQRCGQTSSLDPLLIPSNQTCCHQDIIPNSHYVISIVAVDGEGLDPSVGDGSGKEARDRDWARRSCGEDGVERG